MPQYPPHPKPKPGTFFKAWLQVSSTVNDSSTHLSDHIRHLRNCLFPSLPYSVLWTHVCSSQHIAGTIPHFLCPGYRVQTLRWTSQTWALPWCKTCHTSLCPRPSIPRDFLSVLPRYAASCLHIICPHMVCLESSSVCTEEVSHMKFYKDNIIYWQNMDYI